MNTASNPNNLPDPLANPMSLLTLTQEDLDNLNVEQLQKVMMQSVFIIEGSLFSQASMEHGRIQQLRTLISDIEKNIKITDLDDHLKIKYYQTVAKTLSESMNFLVRLHTSVAEGMDTVSKISSTQHTASQKKPKSLTADLEQAEKTKLLAEVRAELNRRVSAKEAF